MPEKGRITVSLFGHVGTGVIVAWPSGIFYTNQTCGHVCRQPELEGVFVPLGNDVDLEGRLLGPESLLHEYFAGPAHVGWGAEHGLDEADAQVIESALHKNHLLRIVTVDRSRLRDSHEAWVYVLIGEPDSSFPMFTGMGPYPLGGILTWVNSD